MVLVLGLVASWAGAASGIVVERGALFLGWWFYGFVQGFENFEHARRPLHLGVGVQADVRINRPAGQDILLLLRKQLEHGVIAGDLEVIGRHDRLERCGFAGQDEGFAGGWHNSRRLFHVSRANLVLHVLGVCNPHLGHWILTVPDSIMMFGSVLTGSGGQPTQDPSCLG